VINSPIIFGPLVDNYSSVYFSLLITLCYSVHVK